MPRNTPDQIVDGVPMISDGSNGFGVVGADGNNSPRGTDAPAPAPKFVPLAGTKNLSGTWQATMDKRGEYDDVVTGEHFVIETVDTENFAVHIVAKDKKRARALRNKIQDDVDDVSPYDFFAKRGWNIISVGSGRGQDGEISKPVITICQSGL